MLEERYRQKVDKRIRRSTSNDDLKKEKLCVLIQTVNKNEFFAVMLQLKEGSEIFEYTVKDPLCDSQSYYFVGKWGDGEIPVAIIQTNMGSNGLYGSWYETKKAFYNLPHLKYIFAVGICGGVRGKVEMCEVIVSKAIIGYTELKMTKSDWINRAFSSVSTDKKFYHFYSRAANQPAKIKNAFEVIMSGPWLIKCTGVQKKLLETCPQAFAFEMEGIGIVQACDGKSKIEVLVVKGVSDFADEHKNDCYQPEAALNAAESLCEVMTKAPPEMFRW